MLSSCAAGFILMAICKYRMHQLKVRDGFLIVTLCWLISAVLGAITDAGIPVVAHIGMTPQSVNAFGGFKVQGKSEEAAAQIIQDAYDVQEAGAFAVVMECVPAKLAALISQKLMIPTIGIGAGEGCDGQVLVWQDMLGLFTDYVPKFVKQFANVGETMVQAFKDYDREVKEGVFPTEAHGFKIDDEIIEKLKDK